MYTIAQIRKAGNEGEISTIDIEHLIATLVRLYGMGYRFVMDEDSKNAKFEGTGSPNFA